MDCPKCDAEMEVINHQGIEIDRCTACFGLWFDHLEQDDLKKLSGAEDIDIGDEFVGATYNDLKDIHCPRCQTLLQVKQEQTSLLLIKFDSCPDCRGSFFDAGEFRDYMDEEMFESFQQLLNQS